MTDLFISLLALLRRYFLIDFIFIVCSLAFPTYAYFAANWILSNTVNRILEAPFVAKFPFTVIAFLVFLATWYHRKRKLSRDGEVHLDDTGLTGRQIGGRLFLIFTVVVIYIKNYVLNDATTIVMPYVVDRWALALELLYCWVASLIVVDLLNWVTFKLLRRG